MILIQMIIIENENNAMIAMIKIIMMKIMIIIRILIRMIIFLITKLKFIQNKINIKIDIKTLNWNIKILEQNIQNL